MIGWYSVLLEPDQVVEVRVPKARDRPGSPRTSNLSRFFGPDQLPEMVREALRLSGKAPGIYWTLNPVDPALLGGTRAATDRDVLRRRWLLIDCDPRRPADTSATDAEKAEALDVARAIRDHLRAEGWPEPILADSGNGWHLPYRIDLPAHDQELVKRCLQALAAQFGTAEVDVDTNVSNPSRICKLYGTLAAKGDPTPERPHRYARVVEIPDRLDPVPGELLEALADSVTIEKLAPPVVTPPASSARPGAESNGRWSPEARAVAYLERCDPAIAQQKGHNKTFAVACKVGPGFDLLPDVALRLLREVYNPRCVPPWSEKELRHKVDDAYAKETRRGWLRDANRDEQPRKRAATGRTGDDAKLLDARLAKRPRTDLGNAERLVARHGRDLRYCHPWSKWLTWDDRHWRIDNRAAARRMAKATVRAMYGEAVSIEDEDRRKEHVQWAMTSESHTRLKAMLALAEAEPNIPILTDEMDPDPWVLNCLNGTLDLRTGNLRPHRREDNITKLCPVKYDATATCPLWEKTIATVFARNEALIRFFQRLCGVILTGSVAEQILPILYGKGSNGKSTILNVLMNILGTDYAMKAMPELLMVRRGGEAHPTERADLFGKRLVVAIETGEGARLNETLIKELTGSDKIRARRMREDPWEFQPTHKVLLCTNHKPAVKGTDHAIWRRLKLIPFTVTIPDSEQDLGLPGKLAAESSGILAWCVRGCLDWQREGLATPNEVTEATAQYREDEDTLAGFLTENCVINPGIRAKATPLYEHYKQWAEAAGEHVMTQKAFGTAMTERGFERIVSNGKWYLGLGLRSEENQSNRAAF
jgi:putative DNA primase/helicase